MPHFFFNYNSRGTTSVDDCGTEFPTLEAAYLDAYESALEIAIEKLRARQDPTRDSFEIVDENQNVLMHLPFTEVLQPAAAFHVSPNRQHASLMRQQTTVALESCCREMARGEKLKNELRRELEKAREMSRAIRASLRTSHAT